MAVNPLVPYTDLIQPDVEQAVAPLDEGAPVGLSAPDPFSVQPMSAQMLAEFNPPQPVDDSTGSPKPFNDEAKLDRSQVVNGNVGAPMGVPLPLPALSGPQALKASEATQGAAWQEALGQMILQEKPASAQKQDAGAVALPKYDEAQPRVELAQPQAFVADGTPAPTTKKSPGKYITDDPAAQNKIVGLARNFVGNAAYAFGANSFGGSSREGMVQAAYGYAGVKDFPALVTAIANRGDEVPVKKLKPGDLVTWSSGNALFGHDQVGIYIGNGQMVSATQAAGFHVMNVSGLKGDVNGVRIRNDANGGGVSLSSTDFASQAARNAARATVDAVNNIFGGNNSQKKNSSGGKSSGGGKGGSPSGKGSKYYGSDQDNTNNSSHHYTGIGATK